MRHLLLQSLLLAGTIGVSALTASPAAAQSQDRVLDIYGDEKCPASNGEQIVVCRHHSIEEKYRIPKDLREATPTPQSAGGNVGGVSAVNTTGGTGVQVQSCNSIGAGVNAGCLTNELSNWKANQAAQKKAEAAVP